MSELMHSIKTRRALLAVREDIEMRDMQRQHAIQLAVQTMASREQLNKEADCLATIANASIDLWFRNIVEFDELEDVSQKLENTFSMIDQNEQADTLAVQALKQLYRI